MTSKTGKVFASVFAVFAFILAGWSFFSCNHLIVDACHFSLISLGFPVSFPIGLVMLFANMETPSAISPIQQQILLYISFIISSVIYMILFYFIGAWIETMRMKNRK